MNSTNVPTFEVNTAASVRTCIIQVNESLTMVACLLHEEMDGKNRLCIAELPYDSALGGKSLPFLKPPPDK